MSPAHKLDSFDRIYARVPPVQRERLLRFRAAHPLRHLDHGGVRWEYLSGGSAAECLVIAGGASGIGELAFRQMLDFEVQYRVLALSYPAVGTMAELVEGVSRILDFERLEQVHLLGGSFGGLVAQCFARRHPERIASLILSHTGLPQARRATKLLLLLKLLPLIPIRTLRWALRQEASKLLPGEHPEAEFWRAYFQEVFAGLGRRDLQARYRCMVDLDRHYVFTRSDLAGWPGKILILEADNDPVVPPGQRRAVRDLYPQALVHTFQGTGHASAWVTPELYHRVVRDFLSGVRDGAAGHCPPTAAGHP